MGQRAMMAVGTKVVLHSTLDVRLDGQTGKVVGFHNTDASDVYLIAFDTQPEGYNPVIGIVPACVKSL